MDTEKCLDSVELASLCELFLALGVPRAIFQVLSLWESLERHVWLEGSPTGTSIRSDRPRGIPQGDPLAPWSLNLIMHTWLQSLPRRPQLVKVYLDDRGFLDSSVARLSSVLRRTNFCDHAFGLSVNHGKSARAQVGRPRARADAEWLQLPLKTSVKYLSMQLESKTQIAMHLGKDRARKVCSNRARASHSAP